MKKNILLLLFVCFSFSQIVYDGSPIFPLEDNDQIQFIDVSNSATIDRNFHPMVYQFGEEYDTDINVIDQAQIYIDDNMYTFLLGISSPGAYGLGFNFSDFYLTPGAEVYFYERDRSSYFGALTYRNNKSTGDITTSIIKGDHIVIEISVPQDEIDDIRLHLDSVIHDYEDIMNYYNTLESDREDCNTNVSCPQGNNWSDQINGVVRVSMGGGLCSASVVNNTSYDRTPYVLFADHCVMGSSSGYVFYFNYQSSSCSGTTGPLNQSISGSTLLASEDINSGPDFALLVINSDIPDSYNPFYVGWSNSSLAPQEAVGIHHPGADIKKISFTNDNVSSNGYFWEFQYDDGRVIPGSSGSPFFDQNKRQVGIASYIYTNYCDPSPDCYCSQQYDHGYGRFDQAWNLGLAQYLDPFNTGQTYIDGISITGISIQHQPYEDIPFEDSDIDFSASVTAFTGSIDAVDLYYSINNQWSSTEMSAPPGSDVYTATLDGIYDGMIIKYYILAVNSEGVVQTFPTDAPENNILFIVGDLPDVYTTDFESSTEGWTVGDLDDDATAGIWELAEPIATYDDDNNQVQPGSDHTADGTFCFITGNGFENGNGGYDDVDGGKTSLTSPEFNLSGYDDAVLTLWQWYTNNVGDNGGSDRWLIQLSTDAGNNWIDIENTSSSNTTWVKNRFILSDFIEMTDNIKIKFIAEDIFNDGDAGSGGSLVEAAIDDFKIEYVSYQQYTPGDINNDSEINVLDVVLLVNMVLGTEAQNFLTGDLNEDSEINVLDIVVLISMILDS